MKTFAGLLLIMLAAVAGGYYYIHKYGGEAASSYRTATVKRDKMMPTISATGTLEPEETIDVGAQVAGLIKSLGTDPKDKTRSIDYGSEVEPDTVLALIDDSVYRAQFDSSKAALGQSVATLAQQKANLALAQANIKRDEELQKVKGALPPSQYDADFAACEVAKANIAGGQAAIEQCQASLALAKTNLGYCVIKAPVKGVIVDRRVNVGQTVVSALNAPSLFLLAKDLKRIQAWASVNEADIGKIHPGQAVHFTVDAYPNEQFVGKVLQIRLNATMTQNVVTYTVVVETENPDLKLLPYMTTNLQFELENHDNALVVPNAALRWKPRKVQISPEYADAAAIEPGGGKRGSHDKAGGKADSKAGSDEGQTTGGDHASVKDTASAAVSTKDSVASVPKETAASTGVTASTKSPDDKNKSPEDKVKAAIAQKRKQDDAKVKAKDSAVAAVAAKKERSKEARLPAKPHEHHEWGRIWAKDGDFVRPIDVRIVATDGTMTEVSGKDVEDGMEVVVGENVAADDSADTTNPFAPKMFGKKR